VWGLTKEGGEIPLELSLFPGKPGSGVAAVGVARDISERRKAEQALEESRQLYRGIISDVNVGIIVADSKGRILEFNPVAERIYSLRREDALKMRVWDLARRFTLRDADPQKIREAFSTYEAKRTYPGRKLRYEIRVNGTTKIIDSKISVLRAGKRNAFIQVVEDVTEKAKLERALQESEAQYRGIFNGATEAFLIIDSGGRIVEANPQACKMHGYPHEELVGMKVKNLVHPEYHKLAGDFLQNVRGKGEFETEWLDIRKDGSQLNVEVKGTIIQYGGKEHLLATINDITERKKQQKQLELYSKHLEDLVEERTRQMEEAQRKSIQSERMAAIGQTAAMVGHDLRAPLQVMKNYAFLARRSLKRSPPSPGDAEDSVRGIEEQIRYMERIVSDLRDLSRPVEIRAAFTDLGGLVKEVLSTQSVPDTVNVSVHVEKGGVQAEVDRDLMKRVLTNLVQNALQAMGHKGRLRIRLGRNEDSVVLKVEDNGPGIPDENMKRLFEPFFTTKKRGQGFGLAVCKNVVEAHGGTIEVQSQVGKGTTFVISLPIDHRPENSERLAAQPVETEGV